MKLKKLNLLFPIWVAAGAALCYFGKVDLAVLLLIIASKFDVYLNFD